MESVFDDGVWIYMVFLWGIIIQRSCASKQCNYERVNSVGGRLGDIRLGPWHRLGSAQVGSRVHIVGVILSESTLIFLGRNMMELLSPPILPVQLLLSFRAAADDRYQLIR